MIGTSQPGEHRAQSKSLCHRHVDVFTVGLLSDRARRETSLPLSTHLPAAGAAFLYCVMGALWSQFASLIEYCNVDVLRPGLLSNL